MHSRAEESFTYVVCRTFDLIHIICADSHQCRYHIEDHRHSSQHTVSKPLPVFYYHFHQQMTLQHYFQFQAVIYPSTQPCSSTRGITSTVSRTPFAACGVYVEAVKQVDYWWFLIASPVVGLLAVPFGE